jgi:rhodanese-related sulfurtransferase
MPRDIQRDEVRRMVATGAQLVDVLAAEEYAAEHIVSATNLPLKALNRETASQLDRDRPVITYCHDYQ